MDDAKFVRIAAGDDTGPTGLADRALTPGLDKSDALIRQAVKVGGGDDVMSGAAHDIMAVLVSKNKADCIDLVDIGNSFCDGNRDRKNTFGEFSELEYPKNLTSNVNVT